VTSSPGVTPSPCLKWDFSSCLGFPVALENSPSSWAELPLSCTLNVTWEGQTPTSGLRDWGNTLLLLIAQGHPVLSPLLLDLNLRCSLPVPQLEAPFVFNTSLNSTYF
jgi:hypothetical protein